MTDSSPFASADELLAEARAGRMIILLDEAKGDADLVLPADAIDAQAVNFMATHGRGLVCLALTQARAAELGVPAIPPRNGDGRGAAFAVSIEARTGVTSGISAADRARTIAVAVDPACGRADLVTPGHVFPILAREGGILARAGHTEAAVDLARLAGRTPAGVICQVIDEDGTLPHLDNLMLLGRRLGLKIGTISEIAAYRRRTEQLVTCIGEHQFESRHGGEWSMKVFHNDIEGIDYLALVKGRIDPTEPTLVRVHTVTMLDDLLGRGGPRGHLLQRTMDEIGAHGAGIIIVVSHTRSLAYSAILAPELQPRRGGLCAAALRDYDYGARILFDLGVREMILITRSNRHRFMQLDRYGLTVIGEHTLPPASQLAAEQLI